METIAEKGYVIHYTFRLEPAPPTGPLWKGVNPEGFADLKLSPTSLRALFLQAHLKEKYHRILYDNYYMSEKFCMAALRMGQYVGGTVRGLGGACLRL